MRRIFFLFTLTFSLCALLFLHPLLPQENRMAREAWSEVGVPAIANYDPKIYDNHFQNWYIIRDHRGIVYIANGDGIMEYDGVTWRLISTPRGARGRSLAIDANGTVYVGSSGDFGYLAPDSLGQMQFVSLLPFVDEEERDFNEVWRTHITANGIFFQTFEKLFRWKDRQITVWKTDPQFFLSYSVNGALYILQRNRGLLKVAGDSLRSLPGTEILGDFPVFAMLPYGERETLICGRMGLFRFDEKELVRFPTDADAFFKENMLSSAARLSDEVIAVGTFLGGIALIDNEGKLLQYLNKSSGLINDEVKDIYPDPLGGYWLSCNYGFSHVYSLSPMSFYTEKQGLEGNVESVSAYRGALYVATSQGIYFLDKGVERGAAPGGGSSSAGWQSIPRFRRIKEIPEQSFWLTPTESGLMAGTNTGIFMIDNRRALPVKGAMDETTFVLHRSALYPDVMYAGLYSGLGILRLQNGQWQYQGRVEGIHEEVRSVLEDGDGTLWLGTIQQGVISVKFSGAPARTPLDVQRHALDLVLPDAQVIRHNNKFLFASEKGLRSLDPKTMAILPDLSYGEELADTTRLISRIIKMDGDKLLIKLINNGSGECWLLTPRKDGSYSIDKDRFQFITRFGSLHTVFSDAQKVAWIACNTGLLRYDTRIAANEGIFTQPLIREISLIPEGTLIFGGTARSDFPEPLLPYAGNSLHFEFSLPSFNEITDNHYQFFLDGFDKGWSEWDKATSKDYTNLPEGDYTFRVKARNVYRQVSAETAFSFRILPPWYRSPWMILLYVLCGGAAIFALVKFRVRALEQKSRELEKLVAERTAQIVEQRNQLKAQSEKLQEMDALKSRFFANISHEFRTPLTLILGLVRKFKEKAATPPAPQDYDILHRNAARLLQLINQLLDLAKLEAGGVKLQAANDDIVRFLRRVSSSFMSMGEQKKIQMKFNGAPFGQEGGHSAIFVYFDPDKLEKVFYNLLSNAFKFTPAGGEVGVTISVGNGSDGSAGENMLSIEVYNSGPGIPPEKLPYIFDRFYQADSGSTRQFEGTGIGLALVKELVELHRGEVRATSIPGEKTTFTVQLPMGREHLRDGEIADFPESSLAGGMQVSDSPIADLEESPQSGSFKSAIRNPKSEIEKIPDPQSEIILIVEDHPDLRLYIREHLTEHYKIEEAENGKIGVEKAREILPDLVISDIMMPEMDGYQLCETLKSNERTNHIPVILLTAKAAAEDKMEGLETGADDYLVKPFDPEELKVRVRNLIKIRRQMREKFSAEMLLKPSEVTVPSTQKVFLEKLTAIIEERLDDENFSVEMLGEEIGMSRVHLHRKIRAITNQSPSEFIRNFRLQRAAELIKQDAGNFAEIAYMVGFNSQAYFTRSFQEAFGCSPSEYKKRG